MNKDTKQFVTEYVLAIGTILIMSLVIWLISESRLTLDEYSKAMVRTEAGYTEVDIKHFKVTNNGYVVITPDNRVYNSKRNQVILFNE